MALTPRVRIRGATEADLALFGERCGQAMDVSDFSSPDSREGQAVYDWLREKMARIAPGAGTVSYHVCPHAAGGEEASWGPCTDSAYGYVETQV
jgi:hypothetical protein